MHQLSGIFFILESLHHLIFGLLSGLLFAPETFHLGPHRFFHTLAIFLSLILVSFKSILHLLAHALHSRTQYRHLLQQIIVLMVCRRAPLTLSDQDCCINSILPIGSSVVDCALSTIAVFALSPILFGLPNPDNIHACFGDVLFWVHRSLFWIQKTKVFFGTPKSFFFFWTQNVFFGIQKTCS